MTAPKTTRTAADVATFIESVADDTRRADAMTLVELMGDATGEPPAMWGTAIVGFGESVDDKGVSWMRLGFSPRAKQTSIYILAKPAEWDDLLARLGPHSMGAGCLYVKRLDDIDLGVLRDMVVASWRESLATLP